MTRVAVSGAAGRMGRLVAAAVAEAADLELTSLYDPGHGGEEISGRIVASDPVVVGEADLVVEFTNPTVVMDNLAQWRDMSLHAVVGTSGFDNTRIDEVKNTWGEGPPNCLIVPNFSIGAVLMMQFAEMAARHMSAAEVIELHHHDKPDAPSGTALATAARIAAAAEQLQSGSSELVPGAQGADVEGVRVHSVRLPGLHSHQEIILGSEGQTLTIRHDTSDWVCFMPGVLLAVRNVAELPGVTVGLEALLGLD